MNVFRTRASCLTLAAVGSVISFGVLWRQAVLTGLWPGGDTRLFLTLFRGAHGDMLESPVALHYGLPLAAWSLIYYATLAGFLVLGDFFDDEFVFDFAAFLVSLPVFFLSVGLLLAEIMPNAQTPFSRLSALAYLDNIVLTLLLWRLTGRSAAELVRALGAGARYLITGKTGDLQARWKVLGVVAVALGTFVLYQWSVIKVSPASSPNDPPQILAKFQAASEQDLELGPEDAVLGPADAPVQLVVFSDFQCPECRRYARELHTMVDQYANQLQVVFKNFPLNTACNPGMEVDLHPRACEAAYAAEAAREQGKFWPFHDKLFASDLRDDATNLDSLARDLGLDPEQFKADLADLPVKLKVHSDIALAGKLKLHGTPTLFLNKRPVTSIRPQDVRVLIYHLLQEAAQARTVSAEALQN